jgi:hypothetical protein
MTEAARHGGLSPAGSGTPLEPAPEGPTGGWDGDHAQSADDSEEIGTEIGIDPSGLADDDLIRELGSLHRTRLHTLRHGPDAALANHLRRTAQLESEYLTRHPGREVDPSRLTQDF